MTNKERDKLIEEIESQDFDIEILTDSETNCPSTSTGNHLKENAEQIVRMGGYPSKVMTKLKNLLFENDYQGVLDIAARFDSFIRWAEMVGRTENYLKEFEHDPDYVPEQDGRPLNLEDSILDESSDKQKLKEITPSNDKLINMAKKNPPPQGVV